MRKGILALLAVLAGGSLWWRSHPSACPAAWKWMVDFRLRERVFPPARLMELLELRPGKAVLEVGPGPGFWLEEAARCVRGDGGGVVGLDLQPAMLEAARQRLESAGLEAELVEGDARALPFGDQSFDAVYMALVLGEVPEPEAAVREAARVLKPGGLFGDVEQLPDPHYVRYSRLLELAQAAGLEPVRPGGGWQYAAIFRKPA
jgi:ubiquinone/menaquinone biosynthesis C-methylase UbiE